MHMNFKKFGFSVFNNYAGALTVWTTGVWHLHFIVWPANWMWGKSTIGDFEYCGAGPLYLFVKEIGGNNDSKN